jgi:hypothetical protein
MGKFDTPSRKFLFKECGKCMVEVARGIKRISKKISRG